MRTINIVIFLLAIAVITSCSRSGKTVSPSDEIQDVTPAAFEKLMGEENVVLLDVRTQSEIAEGIIPGAETIDYRGAKFKEQVGKLDKTKTYLIYCRSGGRSSKSCEYMKDQGFENLVNLKGGYNGWLDYKAL